MTDATGELLSGAHGAWAAARTRIETGNRLRRWWVRRFGSRSLGMLFDAEWGDLARYNADRHRGVQFDPDYVEGMAARQAAFNAMQAARDASPESAG